MIRSRNGHVEDIYDDIDKSYAYRIFNDLGNLTNWYNTRLLVQVMTSAIC